MRVGGWTVSIALLVSLVASGAAAQDSLMVVIVDPGPTRVNQERLGRAIGAATERTVIRMTDDRAPQTDSRLTIAFSRPDRWVLRYEAHGQVAWTSDRIRGATLQARLAELSANVVQRVERSGHVERARAWDDDLVLALQNEILDPFEDMPEREYRPVTVLWSEVVDPFSEHPARAGANRIWSEVLDPWSRNPRGRP